MKHAIHVAVAVYITACASAQAQGACPVGSSRLNSGEPCIPEQLFNYLYCLSKSGGGKVEIQKKTDNSNSKSLEISVGGKGSGVVFSGEGNVGVKKSDANRLVKEVSEKIDPTLAARCESLAKSTNAGNPNQPPAIPRLARIPFAPEFRLGMTKNEAKELAPSADWKVAQDAPGQEFIYMKQDFGSGPSGVWLYFSGGRLVRAEAKVDVESNVVKTEMKWPKSGEAPRISRDGISKEAAKSKCQDNYDSTVRFLLGIYNAPSGGIPERTQDERATVEGWDQGKSLNIKAATARIRSANFQSTSEYTKIAFEWNASTYIYDVLNSNHTISRDSFYCNISLKSF